MKETVVQALATSVDAYWRCHRDVNEKGRVHESFLPLREEWLARWPERIEFLCKNHLPSGSGFDCGTKLDLDRSTGEKLVFVMEYHRMNPNGYYDGWVTITATVKPSLIHRFVVDTKGGGEADLNDMAADTLRHALAAEHPREDLYPAHWAEKAAQE